VCLLGEGPAALDPFLAYFATHDPRPRESFLRGLSELPNAYVGRYYQSSYDEDGRLTRLEPLAGFRDRVVVVKEKQIDPRVNRTHLRAPESAFGDALLVETARGCVQRCRFCAAGHLFLPYRPAPPPDDAWSLGQEAVGLVGSNVSGHPQLDAWLEWSGDARPALSSIRFNTLTAAQWRHLAARGLLTAALAPETGAERLRRVCNKPITDEAIVAEVERAVEAGVRSLKLYFMIGLPTETPDDVQAIVELTRRCREAAMRAWKGHGRAGALTVSLNPFVPKPHTPFQWSPFGDPAELRAKIGQVRSALRRLPNIELQAESLPAAMLQAILSIGDRRVAELAVLVDQRGSVRPALRAWSGDLDRYLLRPRTFGDVLPWDRVDPGVSRRYLEREYEAALAGRVSPVCFTRPACRLCGAC
jgi:radical SAM superfamily enzyme YgiQ (UPF0313 family)